MLCSVQVKKKLNSFFMIKINNSFLYTRSLTYIMILLATEAKEPKDPDLKKEEGKGKIDPSELINVNII